MKFFFFTYKIFYFYFNGSYEFLRTLAFWLNSVVWIFILVQIILNKVLLVGTRNSTYIGKPVVTNAAVHAVVEEQVVHYLLIHKINWPKQLDTYHVFRECKAWLLLSSSSMTFTSSMQGLNPKVIVFKYKKKKSYRRNIGHRQVSYEVY